MVPRRGKYTQVNGKRYGWRPDVSMRGRAADCWQPTAARRGLSPASGSG